MKKDCLGFPHVVKRNKNIFGRGGGGNCKEILLKYELVLVVCFSLQVVRTSQP